MSNASPGSVDPPQHMAEKHRRSRLGCSRCKARKLKCDQKKPACSQCMRSRVECPGYRSNLRWSTKHEVLQEESQPTETIVRQQRMSPLPVPEDPRQESGIRAASAQPPDAIPSNDHRVPEPIVGTGSAAFAEASTDEGFPSFMSIPTPGSSQMDAHSIIHQGVSSDEGWFDFPTLEEWNQADLSHLLTSLQEVPSVPLSTQPETNVNRTLHGPPQETDSPGQSTPDDTSIFIRYYFEKICPLHSLIRNKENPFKLLVEEYIQTSTLIYNCIVSMAAVHLLQGEESVLRLSVKYHSAAVHTLARTISKLNIDDRSAPVESMAPRLEEVLFASILLGVSSPWFDPKDLGMPHLRGARNICERWLAALASNGTPLVPQVVLNRNKSFLLGAMAYWEAATAFVVDQSVSVIDYLMPFLGEADLVHINPFTGICTPVFINLARIAICLRQQLVLSRLPNLGWDQDSYRQISETIRQCAADAEHFAASYRRPSRRRISGVASTSTIQSLECYADLYNLAALIELYQCFPDLVQGLHGAPIPEESKHDIALRVIQDLAGTVIDLLQDLSGGNWHESSLYQTLALIIAGSVVYAPPDPVPQTSSPSIPHQQHRRQQLPDQQPSPTSTRQYLHSVHPLPARLSTIKMRPSKIMTMRAFLRKRMRVNSETFGLERVFERAEQLLESVWAVADDVESRSLVELGVGRRGIHWIDVMTRLHLETFFG
ncbi:hypothetical protein PV10_04157 [Exophiala mesophila]|uniref:Zn(2)-C6 fungal-type domain-containing protein n=1 Tax=Exophiala mesophila TaxID=212818 RepID=A0A0D1ZDW3_EXOME|nr:uncharacterized protein PV10_04157 [Exophiala mesophila]KIV92897.1 hypothetical protein PV10_04157 [Exophiala mesophila]